MGNIISIRLSNDDYSMLEQRYGKDNISATTKKLLLQGDAKPSVVVEKMLAIRANQREMSRLSNDNKRMWKEIRQELGIE